MPADPPALTAQASLSRVDAGHSAALLNWTNAAHVRRQRRSLGPVALGLDNCPQNCERALALWGRMDVTTAPMPARATGLALGPFGDPLAEWKNDDLLIDDAARTTLSANDAELARILDWPALRTRFVEHENEAKQHRRKSQRTGLVAVLLAVAGVVAAAIAPLVGGLAEGVTAWVAATLTGSGGLLGFWHLAISGRRNAWMTHRFSAERLRQLYFQHLVANAGAAVAAMQDESALAAWSASQLQAITDFDQDMADADFAIQEMRRDLPEAKAWMVEWTTPARGVLRTPRGKRLLSYLYRRRIGVQTEYVHKKLQKTIASPRVRSRFFRTTADAFSLLVVFLAFAVSVLIIVKKGSADDEQVKAILAAAGISGALVAALRTLDEGLRSRADSERYEWYLAAVEELEALFPHLSPEAKLQSLRQVERLSYQELRRFVEAHLTARFIL